MRLIRQHVELLKKKLPKLGDVDSCFKSRATAHKRHAVIVEPLNSTEKATQEAQGAETKVNVDVSKVFRLDFKIHGIVAEIMGFHLLV